MAYSMTGVEDVVSTSTVSDSQYNGAAAIAQPATTSKPQLWKFFLRVTFEHDNVETLMKPAPAETWTYVKGSPTNAFVEKPKALKTSTNAWKPRSRTVSTDNV